MSGPSFFDNLPIHKYFITTFPKEDIDECDMLLFWKNHKKSLPYMAGLPRKYLCMTLTSTSNERAFFYAGILISAKRRSLVSSRVGRRRQPRRKNLNMISPPLEISKSASRSRRRRKNENTEPSSPAGFYQTYFGANPQYTLNAKEMYCAFIKMCFKKCNFASVCLSY